MSLPPLRVYVLPVSGGALVAQLAFLIELCNARRKYDSDPTHLYPHLVLGSSGGNISAYIGLAALWSEAGIIRIASQMEKDMFIMNWWPEYLDALPSSIIGVFQKSLYRPGYGVKQLFKNNLTIDRVQYTEIWTGTYNVTRSKAQFFCNRREGTTLINNDRFEGERILYNCEPLTFTNGNLNLIADITIASASIPVLVENKPIENCVYSDGGTAYSSPLSVFMPELLRIISGNTEINSIAHKVEIIEQDLIDSHTHVIDSHSIEKYHLQLIYFSCCDLYTNSIDKNTPNGIAGEAGMTINAMLNSLEVLDPSKSIDLIKILAHDSNINHFHYTSLNTTKLSELLKELDQKMHYVLNLYPHGQISINLLDFDGKQVIDKVREIQTGYGAHVWYID